MRGFVGLREASAERIEIGAVAPQGGGDAEAAHVGRQAVDAPQDDPVDVAMTISGGSPAIAMGTKWIGTEGWVWVDRAGFDASNPAWVKGESLPENLRKVKLYESPEHRRNFLDCVKSRKPTITPVETAHHSTLPGHLGLISMLVGRKIRWDVAQEKILNDAAATELLTRPYRAPWQFPG